MVVIKEPKTFYFNFDFWIYYKSNESLIDSKVKNEIEQSFSKYKHGNDIHEHGKQQNEWTTKIFS